VQALGKSRSLTTTSVEIGSEASPWMLRGALMGIAAGGVFLIFEMILSAITGPSASFAPFRMIAAVVLGAGSISAEPTIGLPTVVPLALTIHYAFSAFYGAVFSTIAAAISALRKSRKALVVAASVYGLVLWLANFYVIAPALFPWFLIANPVVQFIAHTFFGTDLGLILGIRLRGEQ
jgi:hypothetical protein